MQLIYNASDINEAHIFAGMLVSEGIQAHVGGHYLQGGVGDLAPTDLAKVYVPDDDLDSALALLANYQTGPGSSDSAHSDPIETRPRGNNKALLIVVSFALIVTLVYLLSWR